MCTMKELRGRGGWGVLRESFCLKNKTLDCKVNRNTTNLPLKVLLIDTHIRYSTMSSKWPYLASMAILEAIS